MNMPLPVAPNMEMALSDIALASAGTVFTCFHCRAAACGKRQRRAAGGRQGGEVQANPTDQSVLSGALSCTCSSSSVGAASQASACEGEPLCGQVRPGATAASGGKSSFKPWARGPCAAPLPGLSRAHLGGKQHQGGQGEPRRGCGGAHGTALDAGWREVESEQSVQQSSWNKAQLSLQGGGEQGMIT